MDMVNKGRKMVTALIVVILLVDIITVASVSSIYAVSGRADLASFKLLQGIFRFILTGLLMFYLYKGHRWAKWLSAVLFGLGGFVALVSLVSIFNLVLLTMGLVYAFFCISLIASGSVNKFLQYQRGVFTPNLGEDARIKDNTSVNTQE